MNRIAASFLAAIVFMASAGCTGKPEGVGTPGKKIADQRLATYSPIRRLTYRDACGSEGPITVCVDRIVVSDAATVIEARIRNASFHASPQAFAPKATLRGERPGEALDLREGKPGAALEPGERKAVFMADGHFEGNPVAITLSDFARPEGSEKLEPSHDSLSIVVQLEE